MDPEQKKKIILAVIALCVISLLAGLIYAHRERQKEQPTVMPYQDTTDPVKTADQLKLSDDSVRAVTREIYHIQQTQPMPQVTYYVQAPDLTAGAETVAKEIKEDKPSVPAAAREKTDRTVVTADHDRQKVDVYKVNLRKPHKIKAGVLTADGKAYGGVGFQAGKWEGMVYTRTGKKIEGVSITYTLAEW